MSAHHLPSPQPGALTCPDDVVVEARRKSERTGSRGYASGELWSLNLGTGEKERALPGRVMANYSISADGRRVVFTSAGSASDDGIWVADLDRRTPPRQLTRGGEFRAFFGGPGEIVYISPKPNDGICIGCGRTGQAWNRFVRSRSTT